MRDLSVRVLLLSGLVIGSWALFAPASFAYDLGIAQLWVATDGPYNEHLVRDVGALSLGLGACASNAEFSGSGVQHCS
jgi:hypothetical protein